jgi:hypothetical protein
LLGYFLPTVIGIVGFVLFYKFKLPLNRGGTPFNIDTLNTLVTLSLIPGLNILASIFVLMITLGKAGGVVFDYIEEMFKFFWSLTSNIGNSIVKLLIDS